ncbi:Tad domain-containing protein [Amnibacterium kyonggiense]
MTAGAGREAAGGEAAGDAVLVRDGEAGAAVPLVVGLFAIAAGFVVVAAGATSLHLERLRLLTVADGAALAGAEAFRVADVQVQGDAVVPRLTGPAVAAAVGEYVALADRHDLEDLTVVGATVADGRSATVALRATWRPPLVGPLLPDGLAVTVTSTAAARFR